MRDEPVESYPCKSVEPDVVTADEDEARPEPRADDSRLLAG